MISARRGAGRLFQRRRRRNRVHPIVSRQDHPQIVHSPSRDDSRREESFDTSSLGSLSLSETESLCSVTDISLGQSSLSSVSVVSCPSFVMMIDDVNISVTSSIWSSDGEEDNNICWCEYPLRMTSGICSWSMYSLEYVSSESDTCTDDEIDYTHL